MGLALDEPKANEKPVHVNGIDVLVEDEVGLLVDGATIERLQTGHQIAGIVTTLLVTSAMLTMVF